MKTAEKPWVTQLIRLVKAVSPKTDFGRFRNDYGDAISKSNDDVRSVLTEARDWLEKWTLCPDTSAPEAPAQWHSLYTRAKSKVPTAVLDAFLRHVPASKGRPERWKDVLPDVTDAELVETLINMDQLSRADLAQMVGTDPDSFIKSASMDAAISHVDESRQAAVWKACLAGGQRPSGLISQTELLFHCYHHWAGADADQAMWQYLFRKGTHTDAVFHSLLIDRADAIRIAALLALRLAGPAKDRDKSARLIQSLATLCEKELLSSRDHVSRRGAGVLLSLLRLATVETGQDDSGKGMEKVRSHVQERSTTVAKELLRNIENNPSDSRSLCLVALEAGELHRLLHEQLQLLSTAVRSSHTPADRGTDYQKNVAKRDTLRQLAELLDRCEDGRGLRDELDDFLFNSGVRSVGEVGDVVEFDPRLHESDKAILPGEATKIVKSGRQIGSGDHVLVISKIRVRSA